MFHVYVLQSARDGSHYVGSCCNITRRLGEHNSGTSSYTKGRRPWNVIYTEQFGTRSEAMKRERFLKSGKGRIELKAILSREMQTVLRHVEG